MKEKYLPVKIQKQLPSGIEALNGNNATAYAFYVNKDNILECGEFYWLDYSEEAVKAKGYNWIILLRIERDKRYYFTKGVYHIKEND